MKVPARQLFARLEPFRETLGKFHLGPCRLPAWIVLLSFLVLCGCSSFNRDWRKATGQPANSASGRWEGSWVSDVNGHRGALRCLMTRETDELYRARFRATYAKVFRFSYAVPLTMQPHDLGWEFNGEADLGKLAGGNYYYEGRIATTNLSCTYRSQNDHGVFKLSRPQ